jgi:hypothetical protein
MGQETFPRIDAMGTRDAACPRISFYAQRHMAELVADIEERAKQKVDREGEGGCYHTITILGCSEP